MQGIGDQIYMRPFIKALSEKPDHEIFVEAVLPDLYSDLNVKFVSPGKSNYRTQQKNFLTTKVEFVELPQGIRTISCWYSHKDLKTHSIITHMESCFDVSFGAAPIQFDLPAWPIAEAALGSILAPFKLEGKKLAIIRPVTHRREWTCTTRSPNPYYISWCAKILRDAGYFVISIADCAPNEEWIDGEEPPADLKLHKGELGIYEMLSLLKRAEVIVGGSGFIVPAAIAAQAKLFIVFGGRGAYDNPHKILDLRMDLKKIGWAMPDNFCRCNKMEHTCDKTITNLDSQFFSFFTR